MTKKLRRLPAMVFDTETYGNIKKTSVFHHSVRASCLGYTVSDHLDDPFNLTPTLVDLSSDCVDEFKDLLANPDVIKICWNAQFDIPVVTKEHWRVQGPILDAMVLAQLVHADEMVFSLKHFAKKFLGVSYESEDVLKKYMRKNKIKEYGEVPFEVISPYLEDDIKYTALLTNLMLGRLEQMRMWPTMMREIKTTHAVLRMCRKGIGVDTAGTKRLHSRLDTVNHNLLIRIRELAGNPSLNPNSPAQLSKAIWGDARPKGSGKTKTQTDNLSLLLAGTPLAAAVQRYRKSAKAASTYVEPLLERALSSNDSDRIGRARLHCGLNQNRAITGRFSSSEPNLQNQPRGGSGPLGSIRRAYVADPGKVFLLVDFDQIEMRITASLSREEHMLKAIKHGEDLHASTCLKVFNKREGDENYSTWRYLAKKLNFSVIYGTGGEKFSNTILEETDGAVRLTGKQARQYIQRWWEAHHKVSALRDRIANEVSETGGVRTVFGRFIPVVGWKDHAALNYKVQGSAADVMKRAIIACDKYTKDRDDIDLLLTVHDELIFEVEKQQVEFYAKKLPRLMEDHDNFFVPLTCSVEVGKRWGTKQPLKKYLESTLES